MARIKRLGNGGASRRMSRTVRGGPQPLSEPGSPRPSLHPGDIQAEERRFGELSAFLADLVKELNELSEEGGAVLVEGKRDVEAMRGLGYAGPIFTVSILTSTEAARERLRTRVKTMVIMTDLDSEGRRLASRYVRFLAREGIEPSLGQRRRLSRASRGVFLHIENLRRFSVGGRFK